MALRQSETHKNPLVFVDQPAGITLISNALEKALSEKGHASLVVCGGTSPLSIFTALSQSDLDWQHITVTLADDRMVAENHKDSNIRLVLDTLLQDRAAGASFHPLQSLVAEKLMPFDVVLLGMGTDGHIASLFPDMLGELKAFDISARPEILTTSEKGVPAYPRITMNLSMLIHSQALFLLIKGEEKAELLEKACHHGLQEICYPVTALLCQDQAPVTVINL